MTRDKAMEVIDKRYKALLGSTLTEAELVEELVATVMRRGVQRKRALYWVNAYLDA